ncbi:MAG: S-layer protein, partial [Methanoregula sp.]|nr:S-layer protein [Methanoregula sp.]
DKTATVKEYGLDSEIRYRDALDNTVISDPMKVRVQIVQGKSILDLLTNPLVLCIIAILVIAAGYLLYKRRKTAE